MTTRPDPRQRSLDNATAWRRRLASALGTTTPLAGISATSLEKAVAHFRLSPHPDAWIVATVCGAELERRSAKTHRPTTTGLTAAEIAWREQQARRTAA